MHYTSGAQPFQTQDLLFKLPPYRGLSVQCQHRKATHIIFSLQ